MGDIGNSRDSPTTLDITSPPPDELCMTFTAAASASNSSKNFVTQTKDSELLSIPLSPGITVAGEIIDDPSTITTPFLPGDIILACLLPPIPCLFSTHHEENSTSSSSSLRLRLPTISALELPASMAPSTGCKYLTVLMTGAAILKQQLHIPLIRTPTASPTPAADGGVESYNNKRLLVTGGETDLGAAIVQLLHRALPDARIYAICNNTDSHPTPQRLWHVKNLGASNAVVAGVDGNVCTDRLPPSVDIIIHAVKDRPVRGEVMELLDGMQRFVDCGELDVEKAVERFVEDEGDCVTSLHEMLMQAAGVFEMELREEEEEEGVVAIDDDVKEKFVLVREDSGNFVE